MRRSPKLPPQAEWDFHPVTPAALADATLWEYARSCDPVRIAVEKWLASKMEGKTIRRHLMENNTAANRNPEHRASVRGLPMTLFLAGLQAIPDAALVLLVMRHPDFPCAWLASSARPNRDHPSSRVTVRPFQFVAEALTMDPADPLHGRVVQRVLSWHGNDSLLKIRWQDSSMEEIKADFAAWLAEESARHKGELRPRGKSGQKRRDWHLRGLAAYRLHAAGFTWRDARAAMRPFDDKRELLLPVFESEAGWSDALKRTRETLRAFEIKGARALGF
ncbi:MAG TPA: hypothetical protein VMS21_00355 [Methylomirabilota bacterium]|nr:hypothetical protein [Methylomirabilota bacterium]